MFPEWTRRSASLRTQIKTLPDARFAVGRIVLDWGMRRVARFRLAILASVLCWGAVGGGRAAAQTGETTAVISHTETRKPNRLIHEKSPYLLQHAYNPVDWYPWGAEAFARARAENKPIFLSVGYSTCHWCHVMERESFENKEVAAVMNQHFICIKVDREERPDLDKVYMTAVQATTGSGGWPMSVWLTPDLKPFYCGTYFPPETKWGRAGFREILEKIHDVWETNHDAVVAQAGQITEGLARYTSLGRGDSPSRPLDDAPLRLGFEQFRSSYDEEHGGFGGAPKFPRPVTLNFLFRHFVRTAQTTPHPAPLPVSGERDQVRGISQRDAAMARDMALRTLREMGEGGLFDQLGGGFHRYSVDERWLVSHFEKMLYDQAQLVSSYVDAWQITHDPFYAGIARRTCDYVLRDMTSPDGGFYCAEDADSEGIEGRFYVWTREEVERIIGDKAEAFCRAYGVTADGNWEHGVNVLHVAGPDAGQFADERQKLFAVREKRVRPHRDDKVLTAWNGLMISALARAAQVLPVIGTVGAASPPRLTGDPGRGKNAAPTSDYLTAAQRGARFILANHCKDGKLMRTETVPGMVEDYAFFANGLLDLYETDFDPQWLQTAIGLTDKMLDLFYDPKEGGFFQTDGIDSSVIVRAKEDYDGAEPSGNSMAALLLLRLAEFTGNDRYQQAAEKTLALFAEPLHKAPYAVPQMLCALDYALGKPKEIVIVVPPGQEDAPDTRAMLSAVYERYLPNKILVRADAKSAQVLKFVSEYKPIDGKATAYVCVNRACQLPTTDVSKMVELLAVGRGE